MFLYLVLDGIEGRLVNWLDSLLNIYTHNPNPDPDPCWYSSYRTCRNTALSLDSSDHIILLCVQYGVPVLMEAVIYTHHIYTNATINTNTNINETCDDPIGDLGGLSESSVGSNTGISGESNINRVVGWGWVGTSWYIDTAQSTFVCMWFSLCFYVLWRALWMTTHFHSLVDNIAALLQICVFVYAPVDYMVTYHYKWAAMNILSI